MMLKLELIIDIISNNHISTWNR